MSAITENIIFESAKKALFEGTLGNITSGGGLDVHAVLLSSSFDLTTAGAMTVLGSGPFSAGDALASASCGTCVLRYDATEQFGVSLSASAGSVTFPSVPTGNFAESVIVFVSNSAGVASSPVLACFISSSAGAPINITTNGGSVTINWNAPNGIFGLSCGI
jgi:hypothetical protein